MRRLMKLPRGHNQGDLSYLIHCALNRENDLAAIAQPTLRIPK